MTLILVSRWTQADEYLTSILFLMLSFSKGLLKKRNLASLVAAEAEREASLATSLVKFLG